MYSCSAKIEPIHKYLVERWQSLLTLEENISADEALLLRKGCLSWKQFIRTKRARFGLKSFVLAKTSSGYVWNSIIYTGNDTLVEEGNTYQYQVINIVLSLCKNVLDEGRCLFMDNWYSSLELLSELRNQSTDVVGTVRKDRKGLPKDVMSKKLTTGEKATPYNQNYGAMCMQWKDKRDVHMLTSCVPDEDVVIKRCGKDKVVPLVVNTYNDSMGGVDRSDQMMSSYPVERKRLKKWSKKMWLHLINTCVFNAQILHKKQRGNISPLEFRSRLISQLVEKYGYNTEAVRKGGRTSTGDNPFRLVERYFPT